MITPQEMLKEATDRINNMSIFELRKMFRDAGFEPKLKSNPSLKVFRQSSFRKKRLYLTQKYSICFLKKAINND